MTKVTKSKYYNWAGKIKWAKSPYGGLFEADPEYGNFSAQFYPDMEAWESIKRSGLGLEPKTDQEENADFIKLRRPKEKMIKGEMVEFGRPKVYFVDGIEPTTDIGNGTSVVVNVVVYPAGRHVGHRLEAVTITELVEYTGAGAPAAKGRELEDDVVDKAMAEREKAKQERVDNEDEAPFLTDDLDQAEVKEEKKATRKPTPFKR